jgi:hypothetical protein
MKIHVFLLMCMLTVQCTAASDHVFLNDTTPGLSVVPGDYNATAFTVPLGPYKISFLTRLADPRLMGYYEKSYHYGYEGKGKDYHMCTYDLGRLDVYSREYDAVNDIGRMNGEVAFEIYRYVAPLDYPPTWSEIFYDSTRFDAYSEPLAWKDFEPGKAFLPVDVIVNGRIGSIICRDSEKLEKQVDDKEHVRCAYGYSPDPLTFVVVNFYDTNWAKDVSLVIETLNVTS